MNHLLVLVATMTFAMAVPIGCIVLLVALRRRLAPMQQARHASIVAMCAPRGLVPGVTPDDFKMLGRIAPQSLTNSFSSADRQVAAADFMRPAGKSEEFFSLLTFTVAGVNMPYVTVSRSGLGALMIGGPPKVELESIDFDRRFAVRAKDSRSAVMLLDPGMMQLLLDCDQVNFLMVADRVLAYVNRQTEPARQGAEPVEFEQLFRFYDGFVARVPELIHTEYPATT